MTPEPCGASPADWLHFAERLKLRADLLPVVSNPDAPIAPYSKMVDKGKTPSRYNAAREVHGIPGWTQVRADARDVTRWAREPDYGICIQARTVRAIDIDVEDITQSEAIAQAVRDAVPGVYFPLRWRANSGKRLLAFSFDGELAKRVMPVGEWLVKANPKGGETRYKEKIELLATGQQFVACGTHPSGFRYEWEDGLPDGFPVLTAAEVELVWSTLELLFATGEVSVAQRRKERVSGEGASSGEDDDVALYLAEQGLVIDQGASGQVYLECPWKDGHSGDSGPTETAYFPAGTGGFDNGHFKCLHASCEGRTDEDFLDATGFNGDTEFRARDFPVLPTAAAGVPMVPGLEDGADIELARPASGRLPAVPADRCPVFRRDAQGKVVVTQNNVALAFDCPELITRKLRYDAFNAQPVWAWWDEPEGAERWRPWSDVDNARALRTLDRRGFKATPSIEMVRRAVDDVARTRTVDVAKDWLRSCQWDGVSRVERFLIDYLGAEDTPYVRAVGRYLWTALAGRCMVPGIKADMAVILVTPEQGRGKTTMIETLVPDSDWFVELDLGLDDNELGRLMKGKLVCELAELKGLATRQLEHIKAFVSRKKDEWTPKYMEHAQSFDRRCAFVGTTNEEDFLADPTGERRWLPLYIGTARIDRIAADRELLWAEGLRLFEAGGVAWQQAETLAPEEHDKFKAADPLEDTISLWLHTPAVGGYRPAERADLTLDEVFSQALEKEFAKSSLQEQRRVGRVLRALGYHEVRVTQDDGCRRRLWAKREKTDV